MFKYALHDFDSRAINRTAVSIETEQYDGTKYVRAMHESRAIYRAAEMRDQ
jgi:hypothetical protein